MAADRSSEPSPKAIGVPPTKPRAYYRVVRAHQQTRIAMSRLRESQPWTGVRILGYHRVSNDDDVFSVTPSAFRRQMEHVAASHAASVKLDAALDLLETPVEGQYVCVTFDDGYLDNLEHAVPVLEELGIPATIFAVTDILEGAARFDWFENPPPALGVDDLDRLLASGLVDVQAHSRTHPRLTALDETQLRDETAGAKERLDLILPYPVTSYCYPAGLYGPREVRAVLAGGFRAGLTTRPGVNTGGVGLGELTRTMMSWRDHAADFAAKFSGALDQPSWLVSRMQARRATPRRNSGVPM